MRSVVREAEQLRGRGGEVPLRLAAERAAVDDRDDDRGRPVAHGDVRPARQAAVGDADGLLGQLDAARGRVAVEAGAVPGGDGAGGRRSAGARARPRRPAPRRRRARASRNWPMRRGFQRATNVPSSFDGGARLLRPRLRWPGRGTARRRCARRASARRRRGSGPSCRAARCRRRRAGTARAGAGGRLGAAGGRPARRRSPGAPRQWRRGTARSESSGVSCFLRCLRGELTGSRRESSATAGSPADSPPRTTRSAMGPPLAGLRNPAIRRAQI